jgi:hypothetical protein
MASEAPILLCLSGELQTPTSIIPLRYPMPSYLLNPLQISCASLHAYHHHATHYPLVRATCSCFNWTGLLIEGNPLEYAKLRSSGRRSAIWWGSVCPHKGHINMSLLEGGTSSNTVAMSPVIRNRMRHNPVSILALLLTVLTTDQETNAALLPRHDA